MPTVEFETQFCGTWHSIVLKEYSTSNRTCSSAKFMVLKHNTFIADRDVPLTVGNL